MSGMLPSPALGAPDMLLPKVGASSPYSCRLLAAQSLAIQSSMCASNADTVWF